MFAACSDRAIYPWRTKKIGDRRLKPEKIKAKYVRDETIVKVSATENQLVETILERSLLIRAPILSLCR